MKTYDFKNPYTGETIKVEFTKKNYEYGGGIAVEMLAEVEDGYFEPWATITVNLPETAECAENCAFLDTNNCRGIRAFLEENDLAQSTGRLAYSGFCSYPEFNFTNLLSVLNWLYRNLALSRRFEGRVS